MRRYQGVITMKFSPPHYPWALCTMKFMCTLHRYEEAGFDRKDVLEYMGDNRGRLGNPDMVRLCSWRYRAVRMCRAYLTSAAASATAAAA